jgi:protein-L-isoaspartate(D-aspartate) O-methyltransferase
MEENPAESEFFEQARENMVSEDLERRGIKDPLVLDAMRGVPRHLFVPAEFQHQAYHDGPLPIGGGQTISQPYIVALMTQMLRLKGGENVLEIGGGSGYQAAVLGYIAREVHSIERDENLASQASFILSRLGFNNVYVHVGDGSLGYPQASPYDAIIVTAAAPRVPPPLIEQLADQGRLVLPVGEPGGQFLELWQRQGDRFNHDVLTPVAFVPLRGKHGWKKEEW